MRSRTLIPGTNSYTAEETYNADVYVLGAHMADSHSIYEQLDISQWRFVVLTRTAVEATKLKSMTWIRAQAEVGGSIGFDELATTIRAAASAERVRPPQEE